MQIKIHLLHLVGILFPYIIDDARSKPHQIECIIVCNKCYISQLFSNTSKDLRPYLWNVYIVLSNRHRLSPLPGPYSYSFTLSASVTNRITTDRCALWQLTASICSDRMHRKLANMSRKRNRKNVIRDIFHSSFLRILCGLSISLLIMSILLLIFSLFFTYPSSPTHVY
jgi:hypothetical protein